MSSDEYTSYVRGDVVFFTEDYYGEYDSFMPHFSAIPEFENIGAHELSTALSQVRAVVTDFWHEGVFLTYQLFGHEVTTNHFWWEVEPTGERHVYNDPSRYDRPLFELTDNGAFPSNPDMNAWYERKHRQQYSETYRNAQMHFLKNWQEELTVDEQRLYLSILDNMCAAISFGASPDTMPMTELLKVAEKRFFAKAPVIENEWDES